MIAHGNLRQIPFCLFDVCRLKISPLYNLRNLIKTKSFNYFQERVNFEFETMFETGVDEMNWDDTVSSFQIEPSLVQFQDFLSHFCVL